MATPDLLPRSMILDEFLPLVGQVMMADCHPAPVALTLVEATPARRTGYAERPPFTLIFRSAPDVLLIDGTYAMRGEGFGPDLVWITPTVAPPRSPPGHYYQAVFN